MAWRLQLDLLTEASSNILSSLYSQTIDSYGIGSIDYFNADTDQNKQVNNKLTFVRKFTLSNLACKLVLGFAHIKSFNRFRAKIAYQ